MTLTSQLCHLPVSVTMATHMLDGLLMYLDNAWLCKKPETKSEKYFQTGTKETRFIYSESTQKQSLNQHFGENILKHNKKKTKFIKQNEQ